MSIYSGYAIATKITKKIKTSVVDENSKAN